LQINHKVAWLKDACVHRMHGLAGSLLGAEQDRARTGSGRVPWGGVGAVGK
jgi:hypothetical protein